MGKTLMRIFLSEPQCPDFGVFSQKYENTHLQNARIFEVKYFFQRIFRKNHLSDVEVWECGFDIAKYSLKKIKAFRAMNRQGYPRNS
jgi:hypothetical protein